MRLQELYPDPVVDGTSPYRESPLNTQFARTAAAYGDFAYICGVGENVRRAAEGGVRDIWKYRFLQNNSWPWWQGIPHSCDLEYLWDGGESEGVGKFYLNAVVRFVVEGVVPWDRYYSVDEDEKGEEVIDGKKVGRQFKIIESGMEMEDDAVRKECCEFWSGIPDELFR